MKNQIEPFSVLYLGPPGTGKSWGAATIADLVEGKTLLLATKPREARSIGYTKRKDKIDSEIYFDTKWSPDLDRFEADGYLRLTRRIDSLYDDEEYGAIILDPFSDAGELIEHEILKHEGVGSPGELGKETFGFYRQLKDKAVQMGMQLVNLSIPGIAKRPKLVVVTMHVQPPKEDVVDKVGVVKQKSMDKITRGIEYEGTVLPMIEGGYRRKMAGDFDLVIYSGIDEKVDKNVKPPKMKTWYYMQISPDRDRHSKIAIAELPTEQKIDNDFGKLLEALKI